MARLLKRTQDAPMELKVGGESKWICGCGLSKTQPLCDGTHKTTAKTEERGKLYWYDAQGNRLEVSCDSFPGIVTG